MVTSQPDVVPEATAIRARPGRPRGMRARSALVSVVVVAVALGGASLALVLLLQQAVREGATSTATTRAQDVAAQLVADGVDSDEVNLQPGVGESAVVQVLLDGVVALSSVEGRLGRDPMADVSPAPGEVLERPSVSVRGGDAEDRYALVALGVSGVAGADTVLVAQPYGVEEDTISIVVTAVAVGVPVLALLVGVSTFLLVGRALRPVEAIRRRTAEVGAADLSARVPVPATGDEIARLATTMNAMLDRLHVAQLTQRRFVSDASHELRSPLATLRAHVEVAARHPQDTDWAGTLEEMRAESLRMQRLVDDLLLLAKADESSVPHRRDEVDLDDVVEAEVSRLRSVLDAAPAGEVVQVTARIVAVKVVGDRAQLAQVLRNLTDNAVAHARSRVAVRVLAPAGHRVVVEVADDGPGVPAGAREAVFDRFVRLDDSRSRASGGSGLGLSIVRQLVLSHAGVVSLDRDDELGGARFRIELPSL